MNLTDRRLLRSELNTKYLEPLSLLEGKISKRAYGYFKEANFKSINMYICSVACAASPWLIRLYYHMM
jgi:hypothetical protein